MSYSAMISLSIQWKNIGALLGIHPDTLDKIHSDEQSSKSQMREMLTVWLKQVNPLPTWEALINAVKHFDHKKAEKMLAQCAD